MQFLAAELEPRECWFEQLSLSIQILRVFDMYFIGHLISVKTPDQPCRSHLHFGIYEIAYNCSVMGKPPSLAQVLKCTPRLFDSIK